MKRPDRAPSSFRLSAVRGLVLLRHGGLKLVRPLHAEAHALGWTAAELFALHPEHGTLRIEVCGVMMITGNRAQAVEPTRVVFERGSAYRTKQGQVWGIPVWEFAKKGR